jgi:hypothetical protein
MRTRLLAFPAVLSAVLALHALPSTGAIHVVRSDGGGDFPTIQAAIDAAEVGDVIELTDGTFGGQGNRDLDFLGKAIVVRSQGGNPASCTINYGGTAEEPHRAFRFHTEETSASVVEGLSITGGDPTGIECSHASPTIRDCILHDIASSAVSLSYSGAEITDCVFRGNGPTLNGAGVAADHSSFTLSRCLFENNSAAVGGAIYCVFADPSITDCSFDDNEASVVGGAIAGQSASPLISDCTFMGNSAGNAGGALRFLYGAPRLVDLNCLMNRADAIGGAMSIEDADSALVSNCSLVENIAQSGGGVHAAGAVAFDHCVLLRNEAAHFGGGMILDGPTSIVSSTLVGNTSGSGGGGIAAMGETAASLTTTIIASSAKGAGVQCFAPATLTCCALYGNEGGDWTGCIADQLGAHGNIASDPLFCDPSTDDLSLHENSPCGPDFNPECGLIGALPVGCPPTAMAHRSWGRIRASFR